jgi:branched-subunit amino acid aminotransferase/4-amino-4-deoxychorismate lyase
MIKALINNKWDTIPTENLQIGSKTFAFKSGLYETFRTLNHKLSFIEPHLDRLFKSAENTGLKIQYTRMEILEMVGHCISEYHEPNQRVRILAIPEKLIIYTSSLDLDISIYAGVSTITVKGIRETPNIKTTNYKVCLDAWKQARIKACFEAIMTNEDGYVFEGSRSNIFWVKNGKLFTRKDNILPGVTRQIIIALSPILVLFGHLNQNEFKSLDELFLTNSGSGIVPITRVNNEIISNGKPGFITNKLQGYYREQMEKETL